VGIPRDSP